MLDYLKIYFSWYKIITKRRLDRTFLNWFFKIYIPPMLQFSLNWGKRLDKVSVQDDSS